MHLGAPPSVTDALDEVFAAVAVAVGLCRNIKTCVSVPSAMAREG